MVKSKFISIYQTESFGASISIIEANAQASAHMYWYDDDSTTVYLDSLSVDAKLQKNGVGTKLQEIREEIGIQLGAEYSCLWVERNTWMHNWYKRRGYTDFKNYHEYGDRDVVWMKKIL